jgi:hypothetical protein
MKDGNPNGVESVLLDKQFVSLTFRKLQNYELQNPESQKDCHNPVGVAALP